MPDTIQPPSFDDIAVALSLAASKLRLDLEQTEVLSARIGLSNMGLMLASAELQRNLDLVVHAHHFFKNNASAEVELRAMADRKKRGSWLGSLSRVAV